MIVYIISIYYNTLCVHIVLLVSVVVCTVCSVPACMQGVVTAASNVG
jgi:hypothetical protein